MPLRLPLLPAPTLWLVALATCVVALLTAGVLVLTRSTDNVIAATASPEPGCNLQHGPCSASFADGGSVTLSFSPRPIKPVTGFALQVTLDGLSADKVSVDLAGEGMDMGYNRPQLASISDQHFEGEAMLSVCTLDRMVWRATVLLTNEQGFMVAPFNFETLQ